MALDTTSFAYALKQLYSREKVQKLVYADNPWLALVPKDETFGGKNKVIGVIHSTPAGRSAAFATAQSNASNHGGSAFTITRAKDYAVAQIDGETIKASKNDAHSLLEAAKTEIDMAMHSIKRSAAIALFGTGSGAIGQVGSGGVSAGVFTLASADDVTNFEVGMKIVASSANGGGSLRTGTGTVSAVNRDTGAITYTGTITSIAASDYVFQEGDYDAKMKGVQAWMPATAPSSGDSFFGVDRSVDPTRLAGVRFDGSALSVDEALFKAAVRLGREGGSPSIAVVNFNQFANLELSLGSKVVYESLQVGEIGFSAIRINGPKGAIKVVADQNCPNTSAFLLQTNTWKLHSLGAVPDFLDLDGLQMLRQNSADGYEVRIGYYGQLACNAPGWNARVTLAA